MITIKKLQEYRNQTFATRPGERLHHVEQAIEFVNRRGFIFFWPITGIPFPSLWTAVAGDRPVADAHDDPGHISWGWKDDLLGKRRWYYAKVLRKKATIISLEMAPYFYALSENYGSPEEDYLTLYEQGRLTQEARAVYEALLHEGMMDTIALRKAAHLSNRDSDSRFNKAITDLQADFKILPVGVARVGSWNYAFVYDITPRHFPELPDLAHSISEKEARRKLAERYFCSVGAAQLRDLTKLFGWTKEQAEKAVDALEQAGCLRRGLELENHSGEWIAIPELC